MNVVTSLRRFLDLSGTVRRQASAAWRDEIGSCV